ncbi:N-6 DNA methylase [Haloarcula sp. JP-L23]|uniref:N-6 DNA methylase n=1 Tax=Haloarcula sp. JP-L23 TaxID=2716717 RepID=UPI00140E9DEE|nr:SAM-dependent DNA methyltransferase [Haloarcula sp. JP-L23]
MASPQTNCDDIVTTLARIRQRGHSAHTVFRDWVDLMLYALQRRDDPYLDIVDDYREPADMDLPEGERSVDLFAKAFGQLQEQMAATGADVLGAVYEEYGLSSDAFGQHFTPHAVCELLVDLAGVGDEAANDQRPTITDPACGSGRLLLTAGRRQPQALFVGQDKDPLCAKMAALNCCFLNHDAYIIQGDSLTVEYQRVWQTSQSPIGGAVRELDDDGVAALRDSLTAAFESGSGESATTDMGEASAAGEEVARSDLSTLTGSEQASLLTFDSDH